MRWFFLPLTCSAVLACKMDNPGFGIETEGTDGTGSATNPSSTTQSSTVTESNGTTSATDSQSGPSSVGTDTTGTTDVDTSSGEESTGTPVVCPAFSVREGADVVQWEADLTVENCDKVIDIVGPVSVGAGKWSIKDCSGNDNPCDSCLNPMPYTLEFRVPQDTAWLAPPVLSCAHVVVRWDKACEFRSAAVWAVEGGVQDPNPWWLASSGGGLDVPATVPYQAHPVLLEACDCETDGCCPAQPGQYKLKLEDFVFGTAPYLYEGEDSEATLNDMHFDLANFQSHVTGLCSARPEIDWVIKRND